MVSVWLGSGSRVWLDSGFMASPEVCIKSKLPGKHAETQP